ncbi:MAG: hypothetical protein JWO53_486 [Chlamydiia bacterium]|nr:hypothetical protein [Chlamydiia bacterium]
MKFFVQSSIKEKNFSLIYREEEFSFDIDQPQQNGFTSILINDLQLEIDDMGEILYVWGLCPLISYQEIEEIPQNYVAGSLVVLLEHTPIPGISYKLNKDSRWSIYINKKMGWVCIGNPHSKSEYMVEFAPQCVASIEAGELIALWIHPQKLSVT